MSSKPTWRLVISKDGIPRKLLSARVNRTGDLIISLRPSPRFSSTPGNSPTAPRDAHLHGKRVIDQRYSIHPSRESLVINAIKQTITLEGPKYLHTRHYTRALKATNKFAPLFHKITGRLDEKSDIHTDDGTPVTSLGSFSNSTLVFGTFVSRRERQFFTNIVDADDFSVAQAVLGEFRLVVFWSFFAMGPFSSAILRHSLTISDAECPPELRETVDWLANGFGEAEVVTFFKRVRQSLRIDFLLTLERELPMVVTDSSGRLMPRISEAFANLPFLKSGEIAGRAGRK